MSTPTDRPAPIPELHDEPQLDLVLVEEAPPVNPFDRGAPTDADFAFPKIKWVH